MSRDDLVAAGALHHQAWLREQEPVFDRLLQAFTALGDGALMLGDMLTLAAAVKEYRPDMVLELGRGLGTSTALFRYLEIPVVSVCRSWQWRESTVPMLAGIKAIDWRHSVEAIVGEIADQDYRSLLSGASRPMIFWDAHGYDIAETVFGRILPAIADRDAMVACHDMRDSRYFAHNRPPAGAPLWCRQEEPHARFLRLGKVHSPFEQLVTIVDFCSWNGIPFHSPTHQIMTNPDALSLFPPSDIGWPYCLWHYFLLPVAVQNP